MGKWLITRIGNDYQCKYCLAIKPLAETNHRSRSRCLECRRAAYREYHRTHRTDTARRVKLRKTLHPVENKHISRTMRAKRKGAIGLCSLQQWLDRVIYHGSRCVYCGDAKDKLTPDHIIPLSKGGTNWASNLVPACLQCNQTKLAKGLEYYLAKHIPLKSANLPC